MSGEVFTRVSGESVPVTDAETLRRLYSRGEARVEGAVRRARYAAKRKPGLNYGLGFSVTEPAELRMRVALAPVGTDLTTEARVLRRSFADGVVEAAHALPAAPLFPYPGYSDFAVEVNRGSLVIAERTDANRQRWRIEVETNATVTVIHTVEVEQADAHLLARAVVEDALRPATRTAARLASEAGASGRGFLVVSAVGRNFELLDEYGQRGDVPAIPNLPIRPVASSPREYRDGIEAWTHVGSEPSDELMAAIERQLLRACGIAAWEPEPAQDSDSEALSGG